MPRVAARISGPCPTYFRGWCAEAGRDGVGYKRVGRALIRHVAGPDLVPDEIEDQDEWDAKVEALQELIIARKDEEVLAWFDRYLARCMALIPRPRRAAFLQGVYEVVNDERIDITEH